MSLFSPRSFFALPLSGARTFNTNEHYLRNRNRLTDRENRQLVAKGRVTEGGIDWECEVSMCKLLHTEWINKKILMYSTGNYIQYTEINHNGKK